MIYTRRLSVDGLHNARDLGGYPTPNGTTRFGVFVRSEAPCRLGQNAVEQLRAYGLQATADLRSPEEAALRPSDLQQAFSYHHLPLSGDAESFALSEAILWEEVYIRRAEDNRPWTRRVLELAAGQEGGLLFHCTTGKDRTGLIACYLLSVAGVSREDIAADYCVSEVYLQPVFHAMREGLVQVRAGGKTTYDDSIFHTPASAMLRLQDYLTMRYGSVVQYLRTAGVTDAVMDAIRAKFVTG